VVERYWRECEGGDGEDEEVERGRGGEGEGWVYGILFGKLFTHYDGLHGSVEFGVTGMVRHDGTVRGV
jgi:hypothetical protein